MTHLLTFSAYVFQDLFIDDSLQVKPDVPHNSQLGRRVSQPVRGSEQSGRGAEVHCEEPNRQGASAFNSFFVH